MTATRAEALALILCDYKAQPDAPPLAIGREKRHGTISVIGRWNEQAQEFQTVCAYAITGQWVQCGLLPLVNGVRIEFDWEPIERELKPIPAAVLDPSMCSGCGATGDEPCATDCPSDEKVY